MRTISRNLQKRLLAQAEEAKFQELDKIASHLIRQASDSPIRDDSEEYVYSEVDLQNDVENLLWSAAIRTQDYFGKTANSDKIGNIIEIYAEELIETVRKSIGGDVIGPHEPYVPGEHRLVVEIEDDE